VRLLQRWLQRTRMQQQYSLELVHGSLIRLQEGSRQPWAWQRSLLITTILTLLLAPLIWSSAMTLSLVHQGGNLPNGPKISSISLNLLFAKPDTQTTSMLSDDQHKLVNYLRAHQSDTHFLVAMISVHPGYWSSSVMIATSKAVMVLGGFNGKNPILTLQKLKHLIANRTIRFFWLPAIYKFRITKSGTFSHSYRWVQHGHSVLNRFGQNDTLIEWVNNHCSPVRTSKGDTKPLASYNSKEGLSDQLFDCSHINSR